MTSSVLQRSLSKPMTAINHALTGSVIGLAVGQPWLAIPAAIVSHYVCDALPHFKANLPDDILLKTRGFRNYLAAEAALCFSLVLALAVFQPLHWVLAAVCAFAAAAPDLLSINKYLLMRKGRRWKPGRYARLASKIQWFERPIGGLVEVAWFVGAIVLLVQFFRGG